MEYQIEPIAERHIPSFHAALDQVAREKSFLATLEAPPLQETQSFVRYNIDVGNPHFVVLDKEEVVGWCDVIRMRQAPLQHAGELGMGLLPAWRGRGIGQTLIQQTIDAAWQNGFQRIELCVREKNRAALALYQRLGFREEGHRVAAVLVDGQYEDSFLMALLHPSLAMRGELKRS